MARIFNATYHDPNSLQVDIDDLILNYSATMRRILKHIGVKPSDSSYYGIVGVSSSSYSLLVFVFLIVFLFFSIYHSFGELKVIFCLCVYLSLCVCLCVCV